MAFGCDPGSSHGMVDGQAIDRCPFAALRENPRLAEIVDDHRFGSADHPLSRADLDAGENWWIEALELYALAARRTPGGRND